MILAKRILTNRAVNGKPHGRYVTILLPFVVFLPAAIVYSWPLVEDLSSQKFYLGSDPILIHALLEWQRFALFNDISRFFDGNFYYLTPGALFFGDLLLGTLPIYAVAAWILGPVGGFNVVYLALFVLNATAAYALALRITGKVLASLLAGSVFAFAPIQQFYIPNHQLLMSWWTPLMLWFLVGALRESSTRNMAGATLCLAVQFATSIYWGFIASWAFALFLVVSVAFDRYECGRRGAVRSLMLGGIPVALAFAPIALGYLRFFQEWQVTRGLDEVIYQSATLPNYFEAVYQREWMESGPWRGMSVIQPYLVAGISGLALAIVGTTDVVRVGRHSHIVAVSVLLVAFSFLFSLGPVWKWHGDPTDVQLPYQVAYDHVPGLRSIRDAARWVLGVHLGLSVLAGVGVAALWSRGRRLGWLRVVLVLGLAAAMVVDFGRPSISRQRFPAVPALHEALRGLARDPAVVVPIADNPETRSRYMAWSAESSALPLLNGYNGFVPPTQDHLEVLVNGMNRSEAPHVYAALHALGVRTAILDAPNMRRGSHRAWVRALADIPEGRLLQVDDRFTIVRIGDSAWTEPLSSWDVIDGEVFLSSPDAGATVVAPLNLVNPNAAPWLSPVSQGTHQLDIRWEPLAGGAPSTHTGKFQPPPVVAAMSTQTVPVELTAPTTPGGYRLHLAFGGNELASADVSVRAPDEAHSTPALAGQLRLLGVSRVVRSGESVRLTVSATNLGSEVWDGDVRLGYRWWYRGDSVSPSDFDQSEGRVFLDLDQDSRWEPVAPGSAYTFAGSIDTPERVGRFTLVVGIVREGVAWFAEEMLDVHVVDPDAAIVPPMEEQLGLEGDTIRSPGGETYQIQLGRKRLVRVEESLARLPLVDRRVRLASSYELAAIPDDRGEGGQRR